MKKTIMFDLDGTLLPFLQEDFVKLYFGGLCKKLAPLGYIPENTVNDVWAGTKMMVINDGSRLNSEAFWDKFNQNNVGKPDARALCDDFYTHEFEAVKACLKQERDLRPMFERLKSAGFDIILSTNPLFPECAVLTRLRWVGLDESFFSYITHYDNSTFCKPNPKYFSEILEKTGKRAKDCIIVGNSVPEDIMPAKALGITAFLVNDFAENPENIDVSDVPSGSINEVEKWLIFNG